MKNKKVVKKIIKYRHLNETMYKLDKLLKLSRAKIKNIDYIESVEGGSKYRVKYKYGLNKLNPLAWIYILIIVLIETIIYLKDKIPSLISMGDYSDFVNIKEE